MEWIKEQLADLSLRIRLLFTRGIVTVVYKVDADKIQRLQVKGLFGETSDKVEHFEPYGLACSPKPGAEAFLMSLLGQRSQLLAFVCDPREQPTGRKSGEVILWSAFGQRIWLYDDGSMTLSAPASIKIEAPEVQVDTPKAVVNSPDISLGSEGGPAVARIGDVVTVSAGSSAGDWPITSGSEKVTAT